MEIGVAHFYRKALGVAIQITGLPVNGVCGIPYQILGFYRDCCASECNSEGKDRQIFQKRRHSWIVKERLVLWEYKLLQPSPTWRKKTKCQRKKNFLSYQSVGPGASKA